MIRIRPLALVSALLVTACGTADPTGITGQSATTAPVAPGASSVRPQADPSGQFVGEGFKTQYAWVRLRQDSFWIRPGDRTRLWLDISSSKAVRRYSADWRVNEGRLQRWRTDNYWEWNYWTAPETAGRYRFSIWVDIEYEDGTRDREWLNEYLRVDDRRAE